MPAPVSTPPDAPPDALPEPGPRGAARAGGGLLVYLFRPLPWLQGLDGTATDPESAIRPFTSDDPLLDWLSAQAATVVHCPLQSHRLLPVDCAPLPALQPRDWLLLSSPLAVEALLARLRPGGDQLRAEWQALPCRCIGSKTARRAARAGFRPNPEIAASAQDFITQWAGPAPSRRWLYPCAAETAADLAAPVAARGEQLLALPLYATEDAALPRQPLWVRDPQMYKILLFYSARNALTFLSNQQYLAPRLIPAARQERGLSAGTAGGSVRVFCLSDRIAGLFAARSGPIWGAMPTIAVAAQPNAEALLRSVRQAFGQD